MSLGIIRSRTTDLFKTKGKKKLSKKRFSKASLNNSYDQQELIKSNLLSTKASQTQMTQCEYPMWIQDYKDCCFILKQVEICRDQIKKEQAKKLMSAKQDVHQRRIQSLTEEATGKLKKCEKKLKHIELANNTNTNVQQKKISLAQKIRYSAKILRLDRQAQLSHEREIEKYNQTDFEQDMRLTDTSYNADSSWLSQEALQITEQKINNERNEEITKIVKSIYSLNSIYKQLGELVIHQGSLLDRIDQNIDSTLQHVEQANNNLKKAEQHQKSPFAKKIIIVLLFLIFIFFGIFMLRQR